MANTGLGAGLASVVVWREVLNTGGGMQPVHGDLARNRPGDAVRRKIQDLQPNVLRRMVDRWSRDSEIRSWADGLVGERVTGRRLDRLQRRGWFILHAVQWPSGADIDHLAIGPAGVFTVNSKRHKGKAVWYGDHAVTVNGGSTRHIAISRDEARRASHALSLGCGFDVTARPVISVVHASKVTVKSAAPPVLVLPVTEVDRVLSGLTPTLADGQAERIYEVARDPRTWI